MLLSNNKAGKPVIDNKIFIDLIRLAQEKDDIGDKIKSILRLDSFNRKSMLNTWLRDLKLQRAPEKYIEALSYFLDDEIAEKTLQVITETENG
jgi:hypothetical protein